MIKWYQYQWNNENVINEIMKEMKKEIINNIENENIK